MTDKELANLLNAKNAFIVHFSHLADMRPGIMFPSDLKHAIKHKDVEARSCCVVWPNHNMGLPGNVGVIFEPTVASVISVSNSDSGSTTWKDGSYISSGVQLSKESFDLTFNVDSGEYNEWLVKGAKVIGIFVSDPRKIWVKKFVNIDAGPELIKTTSPVPLKLEEVKNAFPAYSVFTLNSEGIQEI